MCMESCCSEPISNRVRYTLNVRFIKGANVCVPKRSKDATVRIWNLPRPPDDPSQFADGPSESPVVLKHLPNSDQRDITSLDWNSDGTLLATGSYDSILRVWTAPGEYYMSHPQHQVSGGPTSQEGGSLLFIYVFAIVN